MIKQDQWKWYGNAGHFICSRWCRFHLCTLIGDTLVSTVGEHMPPESVRKIYAYSRGITLTQIGDSAETEWLEKNGYEEIGSNIKYETMTFKAGKPCNSVGCCCGLPKIDSSELDFEGYNDAGSATEGHYKMCFKVAKQGD